MVLSANVLEHGHFIFADGQHARVKLEMDHLWEHPDRLGVVLKALAEPRGVPEADVLLGVPTGGQRLADALGELTNMPVVKLERIKGGAKQDFQFVSKQDEALAKSARSLRVYEDVVTTLSSIAGVVRLLDPSKQVIHSVAIWRRGEVNPKYRVGVVDHYLVEEPLPSVDGGLCELCKR